MRTYTLNFFVYAIYTQEPNSVSDMNVITRALDCIVLCQSFSLFNKYWRTHIPFSFSRVYIFFWTLIINLISPPPPYSIYFSEFSEHWQNRREHRNILQTLLLEANVLKNKQKRFISILKNCLLNGIQKHPPLSWDRKEGTHVFLPVNDIW